MQLNKREKTLAVVAGAAVLGMAGWLFLRDGGTSLGLGGPSAARLRADRDRLADEIRKKGVRIAAARRAASDLDDWKRRSLPADTANARSLYQDWLRELAVRTGLKQLTVESSEGQPQRNVGTLFSFTLRGRAGLGSMTQFLYEFYSAGHLHKLRSVDVKSVEGASDLDVAMTVEALSLTEADRKDRLSQEPGKHLKLPKLADYRDVVVMRNLFAPPAPPPPSTPARETPAGIDQAEHTYVVAIVNVDGRDEVWLMNRLTDKVLKLQMGQSFEIGPLRGSVKTIGQQDVVVEVDGRQLRLKAGENLRKGIGPSPKRTQAAVVQDRQVRETNPANPQDPTPTPVP